MKPLALLRGATGVAKPLVERSWEAARAVAQACPGGARVIVATDDRAIAETVSGFGGEAMLTPATCGNGSERCAAVVAALSTPPALVINLQGDSPLTSPEIVSALIAAAAGSTAAMVTPVVRADAALRARLRADAAAGRIGGTTAIADAAGRALYFSKHPLPHAAPGSDPDMLFHIGVYAYTPAALAAYAAAPPSPAERAEGLEQLRFLHLGLTVALVEVAAPPGGLWEVNNPEDIATVEAMLAARGIV
ncbi:hypothetical protein IP88_01120 [alpha proteobacterium AAP81b]|nr:hypothetical protein IP88_01120 [alpha proteobacterium AAP81b]